MDRRELLGSFGALAAAAAASSAVAAEGAPMHRHHGGGADLTLMESASRCTSTGEVCLAHCFVVLAEGETAMAECAASVNELLTVCRALHGLAAQGSSRLPAMARIAYDTCTACAEACAPHADRLKECRDCMEACEACAEECRRYTT